MTVHRLRALVKEDFEAVNALIMHKIQKNSGLIDELASHLVQSGGKRLRPTIVLLTSHACGYSGSHHITLAAMIEFFHMATLLHDDVIDESTLRRGRETANEIWGDKRSILVGDYLYTEFINMMVGLADMPIMTLLSDTAHQITCGELKQLENRHKQHPTEEEYFEVIQAKTSLLFAAASCIGGMVSQKGDVINQALYTYGLHLGNAFQLIDDLLDYSGDSAAIGKSLGDDLKNGIATLPLLHVLKIGTPAQQLIIQQTLTQGSLDHLTDILNAIEENQSVAYTKQIAQAEAERAINALQPIPNSVYKDALIELAHYALTRDR
jgi:octaprenyl-diphosphate synthase